MNARALSLALVLMLFATIASAQTRKIGHRSHSGSPATFAMMLEDDHLGNPPNSRYMPQMRLPTYYVDPFIVRVRKHYEDIAKEPAPVEAPATESPGQQEGSDSVKTQDLQQPEQSAPAPRPKSAAPKIAAEIPSPPFLAKRPAASPVPTMTADAPVTGGLSALALLLGLGIGPLIWIATVLQERRRVVS
jgi:hypothetical protein